MLSPHGIFRDRDGKAGRQHQTAKKQPVNVYQWKSRTLWTETANWRNFRRCNSKFFTKLVECAPASLQNCVHNAAACVGKRHKCYCMGLKMVPGL